MTTDLLAGKNITREEWMSLPLTDRRRLLSRKGKGKGRYYSLKTLRHGIQFDSCWEADCYDALLFRQKAGEIRALQTQRILEAVVNGQRVTKFTVDFTWIDCKTGQRGYGEAKSKATKGARDYPLRKRLIEAALNIEIEEYIQPAGRRRR